MEDQKTNSRLTTPNPDPTVLTTAALLREIDGAKEQTAALVQAVRDVLHTEIQCLQELHGEKFSNIEIQFKERDTRMEHTSRDSKIAIDAALQAAKEAVGKTEVSFTKQIDAIGTSIFAMGKGLDEKITDVKDRLTTIESHSKGGQDNNAFIFSLIGVAVSVITVLVVIFKVIT